MGKICDATLNFMIVLDTLFQNNSFNGFRNPPPTFLTCLFHSSEVFPTSLSDYPDLVSPFTYNLFPSFHLYLQWG